MEPRPYRAPPPPDRRYRRDGDHTGVQRSRQRRRHDPEPARPDHAASCDRRRGRLLDRRDGRRGPRARGRGRPTTDEHRLQGRGAKFRAPLRPHAPHRRHRRRYGSRTGRARVPTAGLFPSGRRGAMRVRTEREAPLARAPRGALFALRGGGGVLGCDDRGRGLPGAAANPRAPAREALGADRLRDRCPCGPRSGPRWRRTAARDPPRDREHPRVLRAPNGQRSLLSACGLRRAAARSLAPRIREGALTVTAGLPGAGIGGMFYLMSALATPLREAYLRVRGRRPRGWGLVATQTAIAGAILAGVWATGWLLSLALSASRSVIPALATVHPGNLLPAVALLFSVGTLAAVLLGVEVLRLWIRRLPGRETSIKRYQRRRAVAAGERRRRIVLLLLGAVVTAHARPAAAH